jgi:hypothetical protein
MNDLTKKRRNADDLNLLIFHLIQIVLNCGLLVDV